MLSLVIDSLQYTVQMYNLYVVNLAGKMVLKTKLVIVLYGKYVLFDNIFV